VHHLATGCITVSDLTNKLFFSNAVFRYDPRLDVCIEVASMLEARGDFVAVTYQKSIYIFGGRNRRGALRSCEKYEPSTNRWTNIASLPEVRKKSFIIFSYFCCGYTDGLLSAITNAGIVFHQWAKLG